MRRKDREITDRNEIRTILDQCKVCRIGMIDKGQIYILPVNFGYTYEDENLVLYIHGAKKGRKYDVLAEAPDVGFEMDCAHDLVVADSACEYSYRYASIIGNGSAAVVEDIEEKQKALTVIMKHQVGGNFEFGEKEAGAVGIIKIAVKEFSCKRNQQAD